jgi:hypothetical protein
MAFFAAKTMDALASVLQEIRETKEGGWRERAAEVRREMNQRIALNDLDEFISWFVDDE